MSQITHAAVVRVTVTGRPTAAEALAVHDELFGAGGVFVVEPTFAKAKTDGEGDVFPEWFLELLHREATDAVESAQETIWDALDRLLLNRGVKLPSGLAFNHLQQVLSDLSLVSTAQIAGIRAPAEAAARLAAIGVTVPALLDFPGLAYRMGLAYQQLSARTPTGSFPLLRQVIEAPRLSLTDIEAINYARNRAGINLRPIFDETGRLWTTDREIEPLRNRVANLIEHRGGARAEAQRLRNSQRAEGISRDADRVIVTEMAEARNNGSWVVEAKHWQPETKLFRQTSARACKACLRLYKLPTGFPRLYTRAEVEAGDALGVNRGHWRDYHVRIGTTHPNCVCSPWNEFHEAMMPTFERRAPEYARQIAELGVFDEAA